MNSGVGITCRLPRRRRASPDACRARRSVASVKILLSLIQVTFRGVACCCAILSKACFDGSGRGQLRHFVANILERGFGFRREPARAFFRIPACSANFWVVLLFAEPPIAGLLRQVVLQKFGEPAQSIQRRPGRVVVIAFKASAELSRAGSCRSDSRLPSFSSRATRFQTSGASARFISACCEQSWELLQPLDDVAVTSLERSVFEHKRVEQRVAHQLHIERSDYGDSFGCCRAPEAPG